jgi:aspartyl-tRNA(Asn)/glutamyl-tRNA(Gln) amidotransferase subunit A
MTDAELKNLTLTSTARLIREKEISPVEVTKAILDRVNRLNDEMRVYITVTADHALERARAAEKQLASGRNHPPLLGVPISLKDLFDTKGIPTTAGTLVLADRIPQEDATTVKRLAASGSVLIGKTNLHEFAFGVTTINPHYGIARNPWDTARICGGSSGGSASSVALSLAFGSLGTDTGGSIRIPASICGIVGLKPTAGLVSLHGVLPLSWSFDHAGPMTRTVEDAALMLELIAGYDPLDARSANASVPRYTEALIGTLKGIRIGVPRTYFFERIDPEVKSSVEMALRAMEKMGAQLVEVDIPSAPRQWEIFMKITTPEAYAYHEQYLTTQRAKYGVEVRDRIESGRDQPAVDYVRAQWARVTMKEECRNALSMVDVIVTPTIPVTAPRIDEKTAIWPDGEEPMYTAMTRLTRPFNITGLPSISVPCGFSMKRLPIGMAITGKAFDEATVLRVAHAYEKETTWAAARPSM